MLYFIIESHYIASHYFVIKMWQNSDKCYLKIFLLEKRLSTLFKPSFLRYCQWAKQIFRLTGQHHYPYFLLWKSKKRSVSILFLKVTLDSNFWGFIPSTQRFHWFLYSIFSISAKNKIFSNLEQAQILILAFHHNTFKELMLPQDKPVIKSDQKDLLAYLRSIPAHLGSSCPKSPNHVRPSLP